MYPKIYLWKATDEVFIKKNILYLLFKVIAFSLRHFAGGSDGKESACNARDPGSIPGLGRPPWKGNGYPLQYSCLENSMDRLFY